MGDHNVPRQLIFENGAVFHGIGFGARVDRVCEVVFNTSMVGYQEILSDPSYCQQFVCMTYPLIGNYGLTDEDYESKRPHLGGMIVHEYNDHPSNFRYTKTLSEAMEEFTIPGISGVDTRQITRMIRDEGSMRALMCDATLSVEEGLKIIENTPIPTDQVRQVSCKKISFSRTPNHRFTVVAVDCGMKMNITRELNRRGCNVIQVPFDTPYETIKSLRADGLFISNGPGNPCDVTPVIELLKQCQGQLPIFGICLGHQLIALANGATIYKLKFGHRGANHPVKDLTTDRIEITSQNHSYAVDNDSLQQTPLEITHINILDNSCEGIAIPSAHVLSVQYHPESAPGPQDSGYLFDRFIAQLEEAAKGEINHA